MMMMNAIEMRGIKGVMLTTLMSFITPVVIMGQDLPQNFVREIMLCEPDTAIGNTQLQARSTTTFYDGLGRPIQLVKDNAAADSSDIVEMTNYDSYGRERFVWLPTAIHGRESQDLPFSPNTIESESKSFYGDSRPFTESVPDDTPDLEELYRVNPGAAWNARGHKIEFRHGLCTSRYGAYSCPRFDVGNSGELMLCGEYEEGALCYKETIDEDSVWTIKFLDTDNHVVLEIKNSTTGGDIETYYVYNRIGQLIYVIPPEAARALLSAGNGVCDNSIVHKSCYYYAYDRYNRIVEKRIPGAEPEYYVYDALDNVVMRQDGNLRSEGKWYVTKLDNKFRKAVEGVATLGYSTRESLQQIWKDRLPIEAKSNSLTKLFYTDTCGIPYFVPLVSYFYDNYEHWTRFSGMNHLPIDSDYPAGLTDASGLLTGKVVWDKDQYVVSATSYDKDFREVLTCETNYDHTYYLSTFCKFDFVGNMIAKKIVYDNIDISELITSEFRYSYALWGQLKSVEHRFKGAEWHKLFTYDYDNVGRLVSKTIHPRYNQAGTTTISYGYNLRGWVTSVSSPLFSQSLAYESSKGNALPRWGGSPSATSFTSINRKGSLDTCSVTYRYDEFDRLVEARQLSPLSGYTTGYTTLTEDGVLCNSSGSHVNYTKSDTLVNARAANPNQGIADEILRPIDITGSLPFSESFAYNADGSPTVIARGDNSKNQVQYITISYDGTQIAAMHEDKQVEGLYPDIPSIAKGDYTTGWTYDANGNRTSDPSRGIVSIEYNERNQPTRITFTDGSHIDNYYRSDGIFSGHTDYERTISTVNSGTGTQSTFSRSETNYVGDFVLKGYMPVKYYFDGGYIDIDYNTRATSYNYYIHDWQGSARAVFDDAGALVQAADYSAYGVPSSRYGSFSSDNRLHLGLEWQPMKGIYGYYNNARFRDAILAGSFYQCDPLAEKYYSLSPYSWCAGNPMKFIDPSGNTIYAIIEDKTFVIQKDSNDIYQLYDSNNNTFSPIAGSFASDLISDINTIASGKRGNELLSFLENSENSVSIKDSREGFISNITLNMIGYDQTASEGGLSFFYTSGYGTTRPQYIALAHEFAHIEDVWKGSFDTSAWYNSGNKVVSNAEKYAIFTENQIRKEHNQPLRLYYEHATLGFQGTNLYIPIRASSADLDIFDYIYLLINYSR